MTEQDQTSTVTSILAETILPPKDLTKFEHVTQLIKSERYGGDEQKVRQACSAYINALVTKYNLQDYKIILLFDERDDIEHWHANRIYSFASEGEKKDIFLLIQSLGGHIEPAYLISKTCTRLSNNKFVVTVPRKAKSAATLIALGAHEIHMGLMSELGPIDPQIQGFPALGMQHALTFLAGLSCKYPESSEMLGKFLTEKLDLRILGYFERINESAIQYAERLLENKSKKFPKGNTAATLADHFVNHYKDHSFVIDADEATQLLGDKVIKLSTPEYNFANEIFQSFEFLTFLMDYMWTKRFDYVGGIEEGMVIRKIPKKDK